MPGLLRVSTRSMPLRRIGSQLGAGVVCWVSLDQNMVGQEGVWAGASPKMAAAWLPAPQSLDWQYDEAAAGFPTLAVRSSLFTPHPRSSLSLHLTPTPTLDSKAARICIRISQVFRHVDLRSADPIVKPHVTFALPFFSFILY